MTQRLGKVVTVAFCSAVAVATALGAAQPGGGAGRGLSIKDLHRVEQLRGDSGGLSFSLARGPASLEVANDFSGVYQIPEDADTPYAGWFARASGATIAVFPRGEYKPGPGGMVASMPANTHFFLGTIPLRGSAGAKSPSLREAPIDERVDGRAVNVASTGKREQPKRSAPDAPLPATVETATDLAGVREAMGKLCGDPVYRANRLRELLERAARQRADNP